MTMKSPLTAAALGLKIGLLLCLLVGCEKPEQVATADEPTPATEAEFTAAKFSVVTKRLDSLEAAQPELEQRLKCIEDCASGVRDDIARLESRLKKQEDKPDCCMMPAASPQKSAEVRTTTQKTGNIIDDAEASSIDDGQKLIFLLTKDGCSRCAAFKKNVIGNGNVFSEIIGKLHFQEVNTSRNPEAAGRFDIPAGTLLPIALLWNPATKTFHQIPADPDDPIEFLAELTSFQSDAAPPRKHLLNLRRN